MAEDNAIIATRQGAVLRRARAEDLPRLDEITARGKELTFYG